MQSWVGIYPPAGTASAPKQDTRVASRVKNLQATMGNMKEKIEIRQQIVGLAENNGRYCAKCGSRLTKRYCSNTCPLRKATLGWQPAEKGDRAWLWSAKKDVRSFWALSRDVEAHGLQANMLTVRGWEATATHLLSRTEDLKIPQRPLAALVYHKGFTPNWSFGEHWGKGPGLEDELAPDEVGMSTGEVAFAEPLGFAEEMDG
ncbi:hypothetical protein B5807_00395 [Epicoccum nigrum]|uniref:Uncharacterized protein n=1 Tax=Epicoccum nigrum TaxID=105696 RepID=A0A1Y2MDT4_EPING|nr:hypothetical protein B5807_00395 [Epicoccum nigrum]